VTSFGWRGMLAVIRGAAALTGLGLVSCAVYGPVPPYGVQPADAGLVDCTTDAECVAGHGKGWYCRPASAPSPGTCGEIPPDAG
jgi:hypothetical protein